VASDRPPDGAEEWRRIAICVADFPNLGDHLALLPLYHGLRRRFPAARLWLASRYPMARIALEHGFVDELVLYGRADYALWRRVRAFAPDLSLCLRRRSFGARLCFGRPSGAQLTLGLAGPGASLLHDRRFPYLADVYRPYRYLAALESLGGTANLPEAMRSLARAATWQGPASDYAVLVPGGMLAQKQWGAERFARVAAQLAAVHPALRWYAVLGEREQARGDGPAMLAALAGITVLGQLALPDLARVFLSARLVLANDCGPGNLAQMAGAPIVLPFGNWDGAAMQRIGWWFDRRPGAIALTTRTVQPITAIAESAVLAAAQDLLADPRSTGLRYADP